MKSIQRPNSRKKKDVTLTEPLAKVEESPVVTMKGEGEDDPEGEVTYFVDEEGRYYYQPAGDNQNLISIPASAVAGANEAQDVDEDGQILIDTDASEKFQSVSLVPSQNANGEVSYVLVVQEETKPNIVNYAIQNFQQEGDKEGEEIEDVYVFEEENNAQDGAEDESDPENQQKNTVKGKKGKNYRPFFTCNYCTYATHRRYLLLRHMKSHSEERPHKCEVCERGFKTAASLQNHLNMHNGVKPHRCKYCSNRFTTSGELVRHVRYKHTHEKPHKCTECDYASVELSKLRRHVRCHTGERPYQCPHCTYASPDTFKLKRHLRTHTGEKPYKCDLCNMSFTQSNSLKAHKLIHNVSEKPVFACQLCPAKCGRKTDLRIHVQKLHTSDRPFNCKRCGKSFPDRYTYKVHIKTHEGERCYKCDVCSYASTTMGQLKTHMFKHTDEKPFKCDNCNQAFRQKNLLRRHTNIYHTPDFVPTPPKEKTHTCRECHRLFARKGNLIRHMAVHDPDSGHQERALELKLGGQRKIKYIDAGEVEESSPSIEQSELLKFGLTEDEMKRGELVTVADGDGQQYVVLEVIQLEDGTEQQVAMVAPQGMDDEEDQEEDDEEEMESDDENGMVRNLMSGNMDGQEHKQVTMNSNVKLEQDMDTCFGFNEEDEEEFEEEEVLGN